MKVLAMAAGLGIMVAASGGCGARGETIDERAAGSEKQPLAFAPPINGGVLLVAGNGEAGLKDSNDATTGTLNDPAGLTIWTQPFFPNKKYLVVADWGNNTERWIDMGVANPTLSSVEANPNLLRNSRAEMPMSGSTIPGWRIANNGGDWTATSSPCAGCGAALDGNRWFYAGKAVTNARIYQNVAITSSRYDIPTEVDEGRAVFCFSGMLRSYNEPNPDSARVTVQALDSDGVAISGGTQDTGETFFTGGWTPAEFQWTVPVGTRTVRVNLWSKRYGCATCSNDGYFDGLQLKAGSCDLGFPLAQALVSTPQLLVGGRDLCYRADDATIRCPDPYKRLHVQAMAVGTGRVYVASVTKGLGFILLDGSGLPIGPFVSLRDPNTHVLVGLVNGVAVEKRGPIDRVYATRSGVSWIELYDCGTATSDCGSNQPYGKVMGPGFRDSISGATGAEQFLHPRGLGMGLFGDFFVADAGNNAIRRVFLQWVTTVGGTGAPGNAGNGGSSLAALFNEPSGVVTAPNGDIYFSDRGNNQIRKIVCAGNDVCAEVQRFNPATKACDVSSGYKADDGDPCTTDYCAVVAVQHIEPFEGKSCSDGNPCNGSEVCHNGTCQSGTPITAQEKDDNNPCTVDSCDAALGVRHQALPAGAACSNGDACYLPGTCSAGAVCVAGAPMPTNDGNDCTTDGCGASGVTHTFKSVGTSCNNSTGKCDANGGCVPNNVGSLNQGAIDRTLPTPPSKLFDDFLASNGGGQTGTSACVYDANNTGCAFIPTH